MKKATFVNFWVGKGTCGPKVHFMHGALVNYVLILRNMSWTEKFPCSFTPWAHGCSFGGWLKLPELLPEKSNYNKVILREISIGWSCHKQIFFFCSYIKVPFESQTLNTFFQWIILYHCSFDPISLLKVSSTSHHVTYFPFFRKSQHRSSKLHTHVIETPNSLDLWRGHTEEKVNQSRYSIKKKK